MIDRSRNGKCLTATDSGWQEPEMTNDQKCLQKQEEAVPDFLGRSNLNENEDMTAPRLRRILL